MNPYPASERPNHPKVLPYLFFTEMWERFSYYGMRAILILYAIKHLGFSDVQAGKLYGAYTGLVYITPVIGGYLADRYFGFRRSIVWGCILMGLGHLSLAIESLTFFYLGLGLLVLGNGFFKPNMSGIVGRLYDPIPEKRDSGYTIFYMGINLGGFFGPILCGYLAEEVSWHYGFSAAGIGMGIGLVVFLMGQKLIPSHIGNRPQHSLGILPIPTEFHSSKKNMSNTTESNVTITNVSSQEGDLENSEDSTKNTRKTKFSKLDSEVSIDKLTIGEKNRIQAIVILSVFSIFFWTAFEQAGSSMNLFADRYVDRWIMGWEIPASVFQSINPVFILIFAPFFVRLWSFLGLKNLEPSSPVKFSLGLVLLSFGFFSLVLASRALVGQEKVSAFYLILAYLFNTWGELCLSPVGLSMVSRLSPNRWNGLLMGIWLMSNAISHIIGGLLSGFMERIGIFNFFSIFVVMGLSAGFVLYSIRGILHKKMRLEDNTS